MRYKQVIHQVPTYNHAGLSLPRLNLNFPPTACENTNGTRQPEGGNERTSTAQNTGAVVPNDATKREALQRAVPLRATYAAAIAGYIHTRPCNEVRWGALLLCYSNIQQHHAMMALRNTHREAHINRTQNSG